MGRKCDGEQQRGWRWSNAGARAGVGTRLRSFGGGENKKIIEEEEEEEEKETLGEEDLMC